MSFFGGDQNREETAAEKQLAMQREKEERRAETESGLDARRSLAEQMGRLMGKRGSRAFFSGSGAGYQRTLGGSNVANVA